MRPLRQKVRQKCDPLGRNASLCSCVFNLRQHQSAAAAPRTVLEGGREDTLKWPRIWASSNAHPTVEHMLVGRLAGLSAAFWFRKSHPLA